MFVPITTIMQDTKKRQDIKTILQLKPKFKNVFGRRQHITEKFERKRQICPRKKDSVVFASSWLVSRAET